MKAIKLAWLELRRFRGPLRRFVPLVLILVPLLYGAMYLWSNWDPYGRLNRVPVAVVNSDRPVDSRGEHINAGEQFVQQLKATDMFEWNFVDAAEARRGLVHGRYYLTIEVPPDFSAKLATTADHKPQRPAVRIVKNDANGFIVGIMADTAQTELQNQINAAAHVTYARSLYGDLGQAREKLRLSSEATKQLVQGSDLSKQGTDALAKGLNGVRDGTGQLSRGVQDISDATAQLDQRLSTISNFTAERLPGAVNALVNASNVAANSLNTIKTTTGFLGQRAGEGRGAVEELGQKHPELAQDPVYQRALNNARKLADAAGTADKDAHRALTTAQDANRQALSLQDSMGPLQNQVRAITAPVDTLRSRAAEMSGGANGITSGLNTLAASSGVLHTGAGQLNDGAKNLQGLVDGTLEKIPPTNPTEVSHAADVLGSPTEIRTDNLNPAHVYGRGLAPFFFAIALWVFGLFAYLLLKPVNLRALADRVGALTIAVAGFLPAAVLGVLGGLALYAAVDFGLGLDPEHVWWTTGLLSLAAVAFVAIDHFLRTAFGAIGGLLSLVLLIVQLTACGGLYPMETAPVPFQAVHPFLPMSYLVDGLRVTISGGVTEHLLRDVAVLAGFVVVFLALTTVAVQRQRSWTLGRLHPQIEF
ncbi:YhgE/Pip domain-containing protein [Saccharopolyspora phatthalungensis]|uniref:Putative membrane protein n=1 Tax=Saccharopolyspora phatthalungensis TaxID=664693 RepID=A0A840Q5H4_9PSEU|nr:YhgE/Pip domain-containing protein [Saccharopolyspora phatthalungensis]MBB5153939.1 putative membrane protein [Saccharopolyspora phatthalungensis]